MRWVCALFIVSSSVFSWLSHQDARAGNDTGLEAWMQAESSKAADALFKNISPSGTARGVVVASPSRHDPNYYFHWIRDASLVMNSVMSLYEKAADPQEGNRYLALMMDFADFSRVNQLTPNRSGGQGEPKFNVDGSAFNEDWGRPQNDGPALRAITLIRFARVLLAQGKEDVVHSKLYDGKLPSATVIKADLEYVSNHWQEASFDLWEETYGQHFYTRMVQRRALLLGSDLAAQLGDFAASNWYGEQAAQLSIEISKHWDNRRGYLVATLDANHSHKDSGLDVAVVLGAIHGDAGDGFFSPAHEKILASSVRIKETFHKIYDINKNAELGTAIGRYPEDTYDGYGTPGRLGNPWVLATTAYSELCYRAASEWMRNGRIDVTRLNLPFLLSLDPVQFAGLREGQSLREKNPAFGQIISKAYEAGDAFLRRVRYHTGADGSLSEQMNRYNGFMQGANDLTWSYASFLTAVLARSSRNE